LGPPLLVRNSDASIGTIPSYNKGWPKPYIYGVDTVFLAGTSPNVWCIPTVLANPSDLTCVGRLHECPCECVSTYPRPVVCARTAKNVHVLLKFGMLKYQTTKGVHYLVPSPPQSVHISINTNKIDGHLTFHTVTSPLALTHACSVCVYFGLKLTHKPLGSKLSIAK